MFIIFLKVHVYNTKILGYVPVPCTSGQSSLGGAIERSVMTAATSTQLGGTERLVTKFNENESIIKYLAYNLNE